MLFEKNYNLKITSCNTCKNRGSVNHLKCPECRGMSMGIFARGKFIYFSVPITRYNLGLRQAKRLLRKFEIMGGAIFSIGFLIFAFVDFFTKDSFELLFDKNFWLGITQVQSFGIVLMLLSLLSFTYLLYLLFSTESKYASIEKKEQYSDVENKETEYNIDGFEDGFESFKKIPRKNKIDISKTFTDESMFVIEEGYRVAERYQNKTVTPLHFFYALLSLEKIKGIFLRMGIPAKQLQARIGQIFEKENVVSEPVLSIDVEQIIFNAYENAYNNNQEFVNVTELIIATVGQSEQIQELLYGLKVDAQKLKNVVEWVRVRENLRNQNRKFRKAAARVSKHGIDKAMTAVATPYLNHFSQDLTLAAKFGHLAPCIARDSEIEEVLRIIEGGRQSVILVGEHGVGKMSIMEGITQRMIRGNVPDRLYDKRLVQISTSALVAGASMSGAQERIVNIMSEVRRAGNIILFINNIHDLVSLNTEAGQEGLDIAETLGEYLSSGDIVMFSTATLEGYSRHVVNSQIGSLLSKVVIEEMNEDQAIQALESHIGGIEYKHNIYFSYDALSTAVKLSAKLMRDQPLPGSALEVCTEAGSFVKNKREDNLIVRAEDVAKIVSRKTGVPTTSITQDESQKLLQLEEEMHKRIIGQEQAVTLVANALRRARAEIRSQKKPIANFLFLGPTGVGKTELTKTIANVYFGGEDRMIRVDMSEFQDKSSIYRLIGQPGQKGSGILTEAVRQQPFSLVLLDEMEKADPDVLNLFLQVFDDGRLTDSVGRVIDFTNTIIIATSNAGTAYVQKRMSDGGDVEEIRQELIRGELKQYYRPEFLNRFDGIVLFRTLLRDEIKKIAGLMLKRVGKDLESRGVSLVVEDEALETLAEIGFDPDFGARPMRRAIQEHVENQLAELILSNKLQRRDTVILGEGAKIRIE